MCDSPQSLQLLTDIAKGVQYLCEDHQPIDTLVYLSSTQPYVLDYKNRAHVYVYSAAALTLIVGNVGTLTVAADSWVELPFQTSTPITAQGKSSPVPLFVRCTDAVLVGAGPASSGGGGGGNVNLNEVGGSTYALGSTTKANSIPVTLATDDTAVTDLSAISTNTGHIPPPGSTTKANSVPVTIATDDTLLSDAGHLPTIDTSTASTATNTGRIPVQGQATMSASTPVVIASNQSDVPTNVAQVGGAALTLGQTTMSASVPVTLASNQGNVPTSVNAVNGTSIAPGNAAMPILDSAAPGYVAAWGSNPANTGTANTDAAFKFGASGTQQVNHVMLQNNSSSTVLFDLDTASTSGSPTIATGQTFFFDVQVSAIHLQSATANVPINAASGIVIRGWL